MYKIPANTLFIGKKLVYVPECHSTNTLAQELNAESALEDGAVIITNNQTAGRGQRGNQWNSTPEKNLTLSVFLKPTFLMAKDQFFLNIFTSLAIHDLLLDKTNGQVKIKWPNDILVNGKKLCGILIENQIRGVQVSSSIVGIGLNVNQSEFSLPTATSLSVASGGLWELTLLCEQLLERLEARYLQLRNHDLQPLKTDYMANLYWHNESHTFKTLSDTFKGVIKGIGESGKLHILSDAGDQFFDVKEITYVQ